MWHQPPSCSTSSLTGFYIMETIKHHMQQMGKTQHSEERNCLLFCWGLVFTFTMIFYLFFCLFMKLINYTFASRIEEASLVDGLITVLQGTCCRASFSRSDSERAAVLLSSPSPFCYPWHSLGTSVATPWNPLKRHERDAFFRHSLALSYASRDHIEQRERQR